MLFKLSTTSTAAMRFARQWGAYSAMRIACEGTAKMWRNVRFSKLTPFVNKI